MKKYIGTKQIEAEPMTMGEAYERGLLQAGRVPSEAEKDNAGYHVKYQDGYESWSPAEPFKKAYKCAETFLDRLIIEHEELTERHEKCAVFVDSEKFREVVKDDYPAFLLSLQREFMGRYCYILEQRMAIAKGETSITTLPRMSFGIAIEALKFGLSIRRSGWNGKGLMVFKQVPAHITEEIIPKMQSLPQSAKDIILKGKGFIDYTSQCLIYNENTGRADSWVPSISDVFAEDWEIVQ
jgi:hypothetical protein|nr:MAG TPA: Protein of unknown function (DUF2829) [Caudoviricetes sp.]